MGTVLQWEGRSVLHIIPDSKANIQQCQGGKIMLDVYFCVYSGSFVLFYINSVVGFWCKMICRCLNCICANTPIPNWSLEIMLKCYNSSYQISLGESKLQDPKTELIINILWDRCLMDGSDLLWTRGLHFSLLLFFFFLFLYNTCNEKSAWDHLVLKISLTSQFLHKTRFSRILSLFS